MKQKKERKTDKIKSHPHQPEKMVHGFYWYVCPLQAESREKNPTKTDGQTSKRGDRIIIDDWSTMPGPPNHEGMLRLI